MINKRRFFYWIRAESFIILSILIIYLVSIFIITPEYIHKILPLVLSLYPGSVAERWSNILLKGDVAFVLVVSGFYIMRKNTLQYSSLAGILVVSMFGFFVVYLVQKTNWFYHVFPFFGLAIILSMLIIVDLFVEPVSKVRHQILSNKVQAFFLFLLVFMLFVIPEVTNQMLTMENYKKEKLPLFQNVLKIYGRKNKSIYFLTVKGPGTYPLITYANVEAVSRFPFFVILPELVRKLSSQRSGVNSVKLLKQKEEFMWLVTEDLEKKPDLLFVEKNPSARNPLKLEFDYISFFSENAEFKKLFKQYHFVDHVLGFDVYQLISFP